MSGSDVVMHQHSDLVVVYQRDGGGVLTSLTVIMHQHRGLVVVHQRDGGGVLTSLAVVMHQHRGLVVVHQRDGGGVLLPRFAVHLHRRVASRQLDLQPSKQSRTHQRTTTIRTYVVSTPHARF